MNKALEFMLNGLTYEEALKRQKARALEILNKPVEPLTYDVRVKNGVVRARLTPITVREAKQIHRSEFRERLFSIFK